MSAPAITYESIELRCVCGELTLCVAPRAVDIAEFLRGALELGWREIDADRIDVATFWDGEVQIRLSATCGQCVQKRVARHLKRAA